jgi:predicted transglutaminase-like cysteine proteinase
MFTVSNGVNKRVAGVVMMLSSSLLWSCASLPNPSSIRLSAPAQPPSGLVEFCKDIRSDCKAVLDDTSPNVSANQLGLVRKVNTKINNQLIWRSDMDHYGVKERWTMPLAFVQGLYGDCEDFALEKRRMLLKEGMPAGALALAVVTSKATGRHAVLVVRSTLGDYVLDNTTNWVLPWQQTQYHWISIQEGEDLFRWRRVAVDHQAALRFQG